MSIDTLYLYDYYFRKLGFPRIVSEFICDVLTVDNQGKEMIHLFADFNEYMHRKYRVPKSKSNDIANVYRKLVKRMN